MSCGCNGFGRLAQAPEGAAVTTTASATGTSAMRSVGLGVVTGLLVWIITRSLGGYQTAPVRTRRRARRRR